MLAIVVVDVGTSVLRAGAVSRTGEVLEEQRLELVSTRPADGLVEVDATAMANSAVHLASVVVQAVGEVDAVAITNQRASTVVWDRSTGEPVGPALGWQDLRTLGDCLALQAEGLRLAPNQSATKLAHLLDLHDPDRTRDLCFGTFDSWLAWVFSRGELHVSDLSNVGVTGLVRLDGSDWDDEILAHLRIPRSCLPRIVDTSGVLGTASALPGSPPLAGLLGDQQASLLGQGCVRPGDAKATFGTGAMLDVVVGGDRPGFDTRGESGCFPIVTSRRGGTLSWGVEAVMLAAGTNVEWLRDGLALISSPAESDALAASCDDAGGVVYVPAPLGLGAPRWDFGARSALLGVTTATTAAQVARAVLEGIAHRGADLLEAAQEDSATPIRSLRVDGGMSRNATFLQALADACRVPIEVSPVVEATTVGAAYAAGIAVGIWPTEADVAELWRPTTILEPRRELDRQRWRAAVDRSSAWHPELSAIQF